MRLYCNGKKDSFLISKKENKRRVLSADDVLRAEASHELQNPIATHAPRSSFEYCRTYSELPPVH